MNRPRQAAARHFAQRAAAATAIVLAGGSHGVLDAPPASATPVTPRFPQDPNNCNDATIEWNWYDEADPLWTAGGVDRKTWVEQAFAAINDVDGHDGADLITIERRTGNPRPTTVDIRDEPDNMYGSSECTLGASIWVNANFTASRFYYKVASHEMLHLAGAEHSGNSDSWFVQNPPKMATCISWEDSLPYPELTTDDRAYISWLHSPVEDRQLHPDFGLEARYTPRVHIGTSSDLAWKSTGGSEGPRYLSWRPPATAGGVVSQVVNLHTGDDTESYQAVTHARAASPDYKAVVNAAVYRRTIVHGADNDCTYADGVDNPNDFTTTGGWVLLAESGMRSVGTSWTVVQSEFESPPVADGYQMDMRVSGTATHASTGERGWIDLDNIRADGT